MGYVASPVNAQIRKVEGLTDRVLVHMANRT